jgi:hypothetical protein
LSTKLVEAAANRLEFSDPVVETVFNPIEEVVEVGTDRLLRSPQVDRGEAADLGDGETQPAKAPDHLHAPHRRLVVKPVVGRAATQRIDQTEVGITTKVSS